MFSAQLALPKNVFMKHMITQTRLINSSSTSITKIHRATYARTYPTVLVLPDGSSINIKYHEPRKIIKVSNIYINYSINHFNKFNFSYNIKLPLDLSTLSDAERKARVERRKPRQTIKVEEELEDNFNSNKYLKFIKK